MSHDRVHWTLSFCAGRENRNAIKVRELNEMNG
jgi:hypothetical protein